MIATLVLLLAAQSSGVPTPPAAAGPAVQPARARANLASYVVVDDYPSSALERGEQGTVRFSLEIGADGRVTGCSVTGTSGSSALDSATCRIMQSRARFTPAIDARSQPVPDSIRSSITWRIPAPPASTSP